MNILYFVNGIQFDELKSNGVFKKILGQCEGFESNGHQCDILLINRMDYVLLNHDKIVLKGRFSETNLLKILQHNQYQLVYTRLYIGKPRFGKCINIYRMQRINSVVEIPTYPLFEALKGKAKARWAQHQYLLAIKSFLGAYIGQCWLLPKLSRKVSRFVIVSSDVKIGTCDCVRIENGINVSSVPIHEPKTPSKQLVMIGVANISYWHAFDRVIEGMAHYSKSNGVCNVRFIVVGEGSALPDLKAIVTKHNLTDSVSFVGKRFGNELNDLFNQAHIAIGTLGLHRQKLEHSSTLKSREYCARGIPYAISSGESSSSEIRQFQFSVPADDTPVDIAKMEKWYSSLHMTQERREEMRSFAARHYQWSVQMKKAIEGLGPNE